MMTGNPPRGFGQIETTPVVVHESVLTCPHCDISKLETMPDDACKFYYECDHCKMLLRANAGDCCVFCSYGSVPCPPIQQQRICCKAT